MAPFGAIANQSTLAKSGTERAGGRNILPSHPLRRKEIHGRGAYVEVKGLVGALTLAILWLALPAAAQQQAPTDTSTASQEQSKPAAKTSGQTSDQDKQKAAQTGTSNDRLFWAMPNFLTLEGTRQVPPLTTGQKFKVVARSSFDYFEYPYYAFQAGISQAENSEPGYGQEVTGYAKRYAAAFADGTDENFWVGAIMPSLLHQDPRFYQLPSGGFWRRAGYAIKCIFITRTDAGGRQFNYSEIVGSAISSGISVSYHPAGDRTFANTMSIWGTQVGWDTVSLMVKEFWPDIRRKSHPARQPR